MTTFHIVPHSHHQHASASNKFEEDIYDAALIYSLKNMWLISDLTEENLTDAIKKCLQVCKLADINTRQHFKKIYVFDAKGGNLHVDWLMSKSGFNLLVMQMNAMNEKTAHWLWQLSNL